MKCVVWFYSLLILLMMTVAPVFAQGSPNGSSDPVDPIRTAEVAQTRKQVCNRLVVEGEVDTEVELARLESYEIDPEGRGTSEP